MNIYTKSYENIYYISHLSIKPQQSDHNMENTKQDNNYNILAPRPWRSFTDSQTSAMVVRKRRAPPPPLKKIEIKHGSEEDLKSEQRRAPTPPLKMIAINDSSKEVLKSEKRRAPTPPIRTVSLKSPDTNRNENEHATDTSYNTSSEELWSPSNSVFDSDSSDRSIQHIISYETTSHTSAISFKSSMELEISVDGNHMEEGIPEQTSKTENLYPDSSYEKLYDDENKNKVENMNSMEVQTHCLEENITTENHTITNSEDGIKTEITTSKKVVLRSTTKKIDLTIRTSQIEDLDESEILKEFTENGDIIDSPNENETQDKQEDEVDFESEKRKSEIILKVEELEESLNEIISNSFPVSTDDLNLTDIASSRTYSSTALNIPPITGQKLSITGWTEFSKGKR